MKTVQWIPILSLFATLSGCRPPDPAPSQYVDLGTDEAPLPPTSSAWHDPSVAKGTADWRPFRKLEAAGEKSASAKPATDKAPAPGAGEGAAAEGASGPEGEIRALVADFNTALAEKKLDEAAEFLTDAQAEFSNDVFTAVNDLVEQLRLLATATPAIAPKVDALAPVLNLGEALQVKFQSVKVEGQSATAKLESGAEARFMVGEEDFWYLESPVLTVLNAERARMQKVTEDIKAALAGGAPDEAKVTELGTALDELLAALSGAAKPVDTET